MTESTRPRHKLPPTQTTMASRLDSGRHRHSVRKRSETCTSELNGNDDCKKDSSISHEAALLLNKLLLNNARGIRSRLGRRHCKTVALLALLLLCFITNILPINIIISSTIGTVPTSPFEQHPIMIQSISPRHALPLRLQVSPPQFIKDRENRYWVNHGDFYHRLVTLQFANTTVCKPLEAWQTDRSHLSTRLFFTLLTWTTRMLDWWEKVDS